MCSECLHGPGRCFCHAFRASQWPPVERLTPWRHRPLGLPGWAFCGPGSLYLYWKPITLVDEDHINDYQNHSTVYLNFKDVKVWLSLTRLSITKEDSSTTRRADPPWITQTASGSPPPPWEPPVDSWDGPQRNVSNLSAIGQDWALPGKKSERTFSHTAQQIFFL